MNPIISVSIYIYLSQWLSYRRGARRVYHTPTWRWWLYTVHRHLSSHPQSLFYQDSEVHLYPCKHDWESWNLHPLMNRIKFSQAFHSIHSRAIWCFKLFNEHSLACFHAKYQSLRISLITVDVWSLLAVHYSGNEYFRDTWRGVLYRLLCVKFP